MDDSQLTDNDVKELSDDELFKKLQEFGGPVGPIVESTRKVYERKLLRLLHGIAEPTFSDNEGTSSDHGDDTNIKQQISSTEFISSKSSFLDEPYLPKVQFDSSREFRYSSTEFRQRPNIGYSSLSKDDLYFDPSNLARSSYRSDLRNLPTTTSYTKSRIGELHGSKNGQIKQSKVKVSIIVFSVFLFTLLILYVLYNMEGSNVNPIPKIP